MHFKDVARVASCELGRFWLRDPSKLYLPSIGEWLWRRVSRPVQRAVSYDMSISENEESRTALHFPLILSLCGYLRPGWDLGRQPGL